MASQESQLLQHTAVLVLAELNAPIGEAVLGMSQEDAGDLAAHGNAEVLAHGAQSIADGGSDQSIQLIHGAVQQHFQSQLSDGAVEGSAVFLGANDGLIVGTPDAHGHHTGGVNQLLGSVVGQHANNLLALVLELLQLGSRVGSNGRKFLNLCFNAHGLALLLLLVLGHSLDQTLNAGLVLGGVEVTRVSLVAVEAGSGNRRRARPGRR